MKENYAKIGHIDIDSLIGRKLVMAKMSHSQCEDSLECLSVNLIHYDRWIEILPCRVDTFSCALKCGLKMI